MIVLFVVLGILCAALWFFMFIGATTSIHEVMAAVMFTNFILCLVGFQLCRITKQMKVKSKDVDHG